MAIGAEALVTEGITVSTTRHSIVATGAFEALLLAVLFEPDGWRVGETAEGVRAVAAAVVVGVFVEAAVASWCNFAATKKAINVSY